MRREINKIIKLSRSRGDAVILVSNGKKQFVNFILLLHLVLSRKIFTNFAPSFQTFFKISHSNVCYRINESLSCWLRVYTRRDDIFIATASEKNVDIFRLVIEEIKEKKKKKTRWRCTHATYFSGHRISVIAKWSKLESSRQQDDSMVGEFIDPEGETHRVPRNVFLRKISSARLPCIEFSDV